MGSYIQIQDTEWSDSRHRVFHKTVTGQNHASDSQHRLLKQQRGLHGFAQTSSMLYSYVNNYAVNLLNTHHCHWQVVNFYLYLNFCITSSEIVSSIPDTNHILLFLYPTGCGILSYLSALVPLQKSSTEKMILLCYNLSLFYQQETQKQTLGY